MSPKKGLKPSALIYPTPVVLVTSVDEHGNPDVCTVAAVGIMCGNPPTVGIALRPSRYSNKLIRKSGEFVVNMPTADIVKEVDYCGSTSGRKTNKFKDTKLTPIKATKVRPPLINECPLNLECKLKHVLELGSHDLIIGEVVSVSADESVIDSSGHVGFSKLNPITWNPISEEYHSIGEILGSEGFSIRNR